MSVTSFCSRLHEVKLGKNDKEWFPRWIRRYASSVKVAEGNLPVSSEQVLQFLQSLLKSKTPAWQRLQAVRAIEAYRNLVLETKEPSLEHFRLKLSAAQGIGDGVGRATKPERLPVVLSRPEISRILPLFLGLRLLMFVLMYGAGLRHRECRRLRVKDVCFDEGHLIVRSGKGDQDRITGVRLRSPELASGFLCPRRLQRRPAVGKAPACLHVAECQPGQHRLGDSLAQAGAA